MSVQPVPDGFHTLTPYFLVENIAAFADFLPTAVDAEEVERVTLPDGSIVHAQVKIGDSHVMMVTAWNEWPAMPMFMHLYVPGADAACEQAMKAGATSLQEPKDEFYGDRTSGVKDPFGSLWRFATHQEDVAADEIERRVASDRGETA